MITNRRICRLRGGEGEEYRRFSWAKRERQREREDGRGAEAQSVCGHNEAVDMMDEEEGNATMVPGPGGRAGGREREAKRYVTIFVSG